MARRSKRKTTAVGLVGSGKVTAAAAKQHLSDFVESQDTELVWILPFSDGNSKPLDATIDFLYNESASYVLVSDETIEDKDLEENATEIVVIEEGEDVQTAVVAYAAEADAAAGVVILLDEDSDDDLDLAEAAATAELKVFDLSSGMSEVELADVDDDETSSESDEDAPGDADDDAGADTPAEMPDDVLEALNAKDAKTATNLLKVLDREDLVELAEDAGLVVEKGIHRKTIAENLVGLLLDAPSGDPEPEEEPEEPPKRTRKAKDPEPEPEEDAAEDEVPDQEVKHPDPEETATPTSGQITGLKSDPRQPPVFTGADLIWALQSIAIEKGVAESKKFLQLLRDEGLVAPTN